MFNETMYNYRLFGEKYGLPLVIMSCGTNNSQKSIVRENGFYCHHCLWVTKGKGVFNVDGETFELAAVEFRTVTVRLDSHFAPAMLHFTDLTVYLTTTKPADISDSEYQTNCRMPPHRLSSSAAATAPVYLGLP